MNASRIVSAFLGTVMVIGVFTFVNVAAEENTPFLQKSDALSVYDEDGGFYKGIPEKMSAGELLAEFESGHTVKNPSGEDVSEDGAIGSDYTVNFGDASRRIVVYGDVNRDASVGIGDVTAVLKHIAKWQTDICTEAADVNLDGSVSVSDATAILKYIAKWDVELGYVSWKHDLSKVTAPSEDATLDMYFTHSTERQSYTESKPNGVYSYDMYMAKNEYEGCHVNLYSSAGHEELYASVTQFTDKQGNTLETQLLFEDYIPLESGDVYPDRLPPIDVKNGFTIAKDTSQGLFIKVKTELDAVPGLYRARVDIKNASGQTVKRAYVYTNVWNFEVPEEPSAKTAFGLGAYDISLAHPRYKGDSTELYTKYYEYMLENRITPWCMPYKPTDERADSYMSDPRVTTFLVYGGYNGDVYGGGMEIRDDSAEYIEAAYEKITANETWAKKALFYLNDEPRFGDQLKAIADVKEYLDIHYPNARIVVPMHVAYMETGDLSDANTGFDNDNNYPEFDGMDTYGIVEKYTTVMCPSVKLFPTPDMVFDGTLWYTEAITEKYGTLTDRLAKSKQDGKETWWYCGGSSYISLIRSGMTNRSLFWGQYGYDIDGFLCWASTEWSGLAKHQGQPQRALKGGEGIYVYPGEIYGIDGPIACLRTEIARDGLEDYEYLVLAEKLFGEDVAKEYSRKIFADMVTFEKDSDVLEEVRRELGQMIEDAINKAK